ncbi:SLC22A8 (predicted) [Pycnogonum litorale]
MTYLDTICDDLGKWQFVLIALCSVSVMNFGSYSLQIPFLAPKQDYWCQTTENISMSWNNETNLLNEHSCHFDIYKRKPITVARNHTVSRYINASYRYTCKEWNFDHSVWKRTIKEDWSLICGRDIFITISSSSYMSGTLFGVLTISQLSDRFGRQITASICQILLVVSSLITAFSIDHVMFTIMRFFVALFSVSGATITYVWCMESINNKTRSIVGCMIAVAWSVGILVVISINFLTRNWFYTQIVLTASTSVYFFGLWMTVESPSWLLSENRFDDGMKALRKVAKMNKRPYPDEETIRLEMYGENEKMNGNAKVRYTILDIFKHRNLRKNMLILYLNWFVVSFVYYALSFNPESLGGDIFINMTISALMESIGYCIAPVLLLKIGRRLPMATCFLLAGVCCFVVVSIPGTDDALKWLKMAISVFGRTSIAISFCCLYIFTAEVNPTVVRSVALGSGSMMARIASVIAPYVTLLVGTISFT